MRVGRDISTAAVFRCWRFAGSACKLAVGENGPGRKPKGPVGGVMKNRMFLGGALLACLLGGCTNLPTPDYVQSNPDPNASPFTVDDLIGHIQCELRRSLTPELIENGYVAQVTLTLKVEDTGGLAPSLSFINTLTKTSSVTYGAGANISVDRQRTFTTSYSVDLERFNQTPRLDKAEPATDCEKHGIYSLSGDLGIHGIVASGMAVESYKGVNTPSNAGQAVVVADNPPPPPATIPPAAKSTTPPTATVAPPTISPPTAPTFGSTVQFALTTSGSFSPSWSFTHFKGPNSLGTLSRVDTDTLVIAFAPSVNTGSAEAQAEETAALAALTKARAHLAQLRAERSALALSPAPHKGKNGKPVAVAAPAPSADEVAASADVTKDEQAYERAVQDRAQRAAQATLAKAQAAASAQNFTTNMILQNLAGSTVLP